MSVPLNFATSIENIKDRITWLKDKIYYVECKSTREELTLEKATLEMILTFQNNYMKTLFRNENEH